MRLDGVLRTVSVDGADLLRFIEGFAASDP